MRKSIIRTSLLVASSGLAATALAGCSPYDPDLGATPYLCAATEPRCPEDYTCVEDSVRSVCVANGATAPDAAPDAGDGFQCAPDGTLEPNDTLAGAFMTDVGIGAPMRVYGPLSICPETDQDYFAISVSSPNQSLIAITRWDSGSQIAVSIRNAADTAIANGTAMGQNALRACAPNLPVGTYAVRANSPTGAKNNYRIEMRLAANCQ
jgi:hypothetical protein